MTSLQEKAAAKVREIVATYENFPKHGITFKDIHPVLMNHEVRQLVLDALVSRYQDKKVDVIVGLESRGYYFGILLASALKIPFVPIRKAGKLPGELESIEYGLEYKEKEKMEIQKGTVKPGDRVLILDDVLVTGGTAAAACELIHRIGGHIIEVSLLIELTLENGRKKKPKDVEYFALVQY